eukprot:6205679-Pleurochrysis_carterae.AAC.6
MYDGRWRRARSRLGEPTEQPEDRAQKCELGAHKQPASAQPRHALQCVPREQPCNTEKLACKKPSRRPILRR